MIDKKFALALLADENYLEYTKQVYYTAIVYGNWQYDLILLAYDIKDERILEWYDTKNIKIYHINKQTLNLNNDLIKSHIHFSKIYLFHPFFSIYEKIIFLDTDIIIRKDLNRLLNYTSFAAADDCVKWPIINQFVINHNNYEQAEINQYFNKKTLYKTCFNTGVMVIHTKNNRNEEYNELISLCNSYGHLSTYFDQGILNLGLYNKRHRLPYVYNDYYSAETFNRTGVIKRHSDKDAVILHIFYPHKPWDSKSSYFKEWQRNFLNAQEGNFKMPITIKPTIFSIWKIEFINYINIKIIWFKQLFTTFLKSIK